MKCFYIICAARRREQKENFKQKIILLMKNAVFIFSVPPTVKRLPSFHEHFEK